MLKIMTRQIATATPSLNLWTSLQTAARAAARHFASRGEDNAALVMLDHEQNQIRQSSRHWLVG